MSPPSPRLVIAALRGGAGKTMLTVALSVALQKRGICVVPFKKGPDYIDAAWLSLAAGGPCYNLDTFLIGREQVVRSFSNRAREDYLSLIEGNRGLYDGMNPEGEHSTAELSKLLRAPVILVADCDKVTRTMAAMVLGCQILDPKVNIQGVILNRVGGSRHAAIMRKSVEDNCNIPVLGVVPRIGDVDILFPERHFGLIPPQEHNHIEKTLTWAGEIAEECLDVERLTKVAQSAPAWRGLDAVHHAAPREVSSSEPITIGVIRDAAFQFYYHENIEALVNRGARIVEISAIGGENLPAVDALYIGGGFPETQAGLLAENGVFRCSVRNAAASGLPIYAECGGFMYLGESLIIGGVRYPMVGALPVSFEMNKRPQGHGYTVLEVERENPFFPVGIRLNGHEFHYCRILDWKEGEGRTAFRVERGTGIDGKKDGLCRKNILASLTHLHALGTPQWAEGLVGAARRYRAERHNNA